MAARHIVAIGSSDAGISAALPMPQRITYALAQSAPHFPALPPHTRVSRGVARNQVLDQR